mmetsp:Transcript_11843/g.31484  ORF Transcript_11843/g.31484 Transcript_11843/m.31484 type:complete len:276 (+) Transcript_11843:410-1237(+)
MCEVPRAFLRLSAQEGPEREERGRDDVARQPDCCPLCPPERQGHLLGFLQALALKAAAEQAVRVDGHRGCLYHEAEGGVRAAGDSEAGFHVHRHDAERWAAGAVQQAVAWRRAWRRHPRGQGPPDERVAREGRGRQHRAVRGAPPGHRGLRELLRLEAQWPEAAVDVEHGHCGAQGALLRPWPHAGGLHVPVSGADAPQQPQRGHVPADLRGHQHTVGGVQPAGAVDDRAEAPAAPEKGDGQGAGGRLRPRGERAVCQRQAEGERRPDKEGGEGR